MATMPKRAKALLGFPSLLLLRFGFCNKQRRKTWKILGRKFWKQ